MNNIIRILKRIKLHQQETILHRQQLISEYRSKNKLHKKAEEKKHYHEGNSKY